MSNLSVNISPGELIDRLTILEIKSLKIKDENKLTKIVCELSELYKLYEKLRPVNTSKLKELKEKLFNVNLRLWNIENKIRKHEQQKIFDNKFISLARNVYLYNDTRSEIKNRINAVLGSDYSEVKDYTDYNKQQL